MKPKAATPTPTVVTTVIPGATKPDRMVTLVCANCRMALYMADRKLQMPTWKCPSCGTVTRTPSAVATPA
jgi:hypothetical protein